MSNGQTSSLVLSVAGVVIQELPNVISAIQTLQQSGLLTAAQAAAARAAAGYTEEAAVSAAEQVAGVQPV